MSDITYKINLVLRRDKLSEIKFQKPSEENIFNLYTQELISRLEDIFQLMKQNRDKYFAQSVQLYIFYQLLLRIGAFTEQEREEFDNEVLKSIEICKSQIQELQDWLKKQKSIMFARTKFEYAHKEAALTQLFSMLSKVTTHFKDFKTHRSKQRERVLNLTRFKQDKQIDLDEKQSDNQVKNSNPELAQENQLLLKKYNNEMEDIMRTYKKIQEISSMIGQMSDILQRQDLTTEQVLSDAQSSLEFIKKGNKNLIDAIKLNESVGACWSLLFLFMAFMILFYDYINS